MFNGGERAGYEAASFRNLWILLPFVALYSRAVEVESPPKAFATPSIAQLVSNHKETRVVTVCSSIRETAGALSGRCSGWGFRAAS